MPRDRDGNRYAEWPLSFDDRKAVQSWEMTMFYPGRVEHESEADGTTQVIFRSPGQWRGRVVLPPASRSRAGQAYQDRVNRFLHDAEMWPAEIMLPEADDLAATARDTAVTAAGIADENDYPGRGGTLFHSVEPFDAVGARYILDDSSIVTFETITSAHFLRYGNRALIFSGCFFEFSPLRFTCFHEPRIWIPVGAMVRLALSVRARVEVPPEGWLSPTTPDARGPWTIDWVEAVV